jgi:hypothetical protein
MIILMGPLNVIVEKKGRRDGTKMKGRSETARSDDDETVQQRMQCRTSAHLI